jgi:hypothetical protein
MTPSRSCPVLPGSSQAFENIEADRLPSRLLPGSAGSSQATENIELPGSSRLCAPHPPYP